VILNMMLRWLLKLMVKLVIAQTKLSIMYMEHMIDLTYKGKEYLSEIYNPQGTLKAPINGWVNPLSGLYPIDFNRDKIYELEAYQRIAGRYNADSLGSVQTVLKWNGQEFVPDRQTVAIFGGEI